MDWVTYGDCTHYLSFREFDIVEVANAERYRGVWEYSHCLYAIIWKVGSNLIIKKAVDEREEKGKCEE